MVQQCAKHDLEYELPEVKSGNVLIQFATWFVWRNVSKETCILDYALRSWNSLGSAVRVFNRLELQATALTVGCWGWKIGELRLLEPCLWLPHCRRMLRMDSPQFHPRDFLTHGMDILTLFKIVDQYQWYYFLNWICCTPSCLSFSHISYEAATTVPLGARQ